LSASPSNDLSRAIRSPVPFWFLNGHIEERHIVREFELMAEKGISEVIVHPRYGLEVEYLSDEWFTVFGWCVREAKRHGMFVWIYDEFNWPSGTAGMTVQKIDPNYRSKYLAVESKPLREIDLNSFEPGVCTIAANIEGGAVTKTKLLEGIDDLIALTGDWRIFNCSLRYDPYYVDTLSEEAVDCFKRLTYEEYYRRFGDEFGRTIRAVFTDEPSIYWVSVGYDDWNLPYTDDYFETFRRRHGYDCRPMIPYLFYPGREGIAFRADYWEHAGFLFNERYHRKLSGWCRDHGLIYTGHNNHEEPLRYQIRFQGDMFGTMRAMDIPGVDHLGKQTLGNPWISIVGHKICTSAAHFGGKARAMSESFGVMDWDTTFANLKRVTDWQYALGINLLVPHAIYHTISGMTKRECPPSFFYQSPHWQDFDYFVEYLRRLEEMLCGGRHVCKVAVLYPSSGLWASYQPDRKTAEFDYTENSLNSLCLELLRSQIDFDIIDFQALMEAETIRNAQGDGAKIKLADEEYELLIVPSTPYMRPAEAARLQELAAAGVGTVFLHKAMEPAEHNLPGAVRGATFVRTEELVSFTEVLRRRLDYEVQISGGGASDILVYRREKDGQKITFMVNRSDKHRKVTAMLADYPDPALFDPETGEYIRVEGRRAGSKTQVQLRFAPNQAYFLVSGVENAQPARSQEGEPTQIEIRNLSVEVPFNVASVYRFRFSASRRPGGRLESVGADEGVEPVEVDVRADPRRIPCNWDPNAPDYKQYAGTYEADVEIDCEFSGIALILDRDFAECEIYVNGARVVPEQCRAEPGADSESEDGEPPTLAWLTDFQDVRASIGALLRRGTNHFRIVSPTKLSEPLRLVGDFRVRLQDDGIALVDPGAVDPFNLELDYPFYSGTVTYRAQFELKGECSSLVLDLRDVRDSAAVIVNGSPVGRRLWAPYVFDLARHAVVGRNEVAIQVRNNMANLILGNPRPLGLRSMPSLEAFGIRSG